MSTIVAPSRLQDTQFKMMGMLSDVAYDNSVSVNPGRTSPPFWPQTLDHALSWECANDHCPRQAHNGLWEIPLNQFYGDYVPALGGYKRSSMVRASMNLNGTRVRSALIAALHAQPWRRSRRSNC